MLLVMANVACGTNFNRPISNVDKKTLEKPEKWFTVSKHPNATHTVESSIQMNM